MDFVLVMWWNWGLGGLVLFCWDFYLIAWKWWVLCAEYVVIMQIWGWGPILRLNYACNVGTMLSNWISMNWNVFWSLMLCLCAWNSARVYKSRSSEPGSPRRDMQGLVPLFCSRLSLRQKVFGLGERPSRLGEWASPKRELKRVGWFGLGISLKRGPHFLSERVSLSGESPSPKREFEECFDVGLTRRPGVRLNSWAKCGLA